jgi:hypothetical protein
MLAAYIQQWVGALAECPSLYMDYGNCIPGSHTAAIYYYSLVFEQGAIFRACTRHSKGPWASYHQGSKSHNHTTCTQAYYEQICISRLFFWQRGFLASRDKDLDLNMLNLTNHTCFFIWIKKWLLYPPYNFTNVLGRSYGLVIVSCLYLYIPLVLALQVVNADVLEFRICVQ